MNTNTPMNNTKIDQNKINVPSGIATKKGEPAVKQNEPSVDHKPESDLQLTDMQKKSDLQDMQKSDKAKSDTAKFDKVKADKQNVPEVRAAQK
jgi:hypothetical protein